MDEVKSAEGKILLFIDEMHLVIGAGKSEWTRAGAMQEQLQTGASMRCKNAVQACTEQS
jgi:ATP-dependent Clp protease ATP-binding subunit ClpB